MKNFIRFKLKSFTILEIGITLLISSIVISISYYIYVSMEKQVRLYFQEQMDYYSLNQTEYFIQNDLFESKKVIRRNKIISLIKFNNDTITYQIINDTLTRNIKDKVIKMSKAKRIEFIPPNGQFSAFSILFVVNGQEIKGFYFDEMGVSNVINN